VAFAPAAAPGSASEGGIAAEEAATPDGSALEPGHRQELESKYFDWCSARLAERFLQLSPVEIYELAERGPTEQGRPSLGLTPGIVPDAGSSTFQDVVARVTEVLAHELQLPSFDVWVAEYRRAPEQFDAEMLGLWRAGG